MKKLKEELKYGKKGITLISLVVTIIVLLILAGVSIATLTGDNGILTRTQEAKNKTEEVALEEKIKLLATETILNQYTGESEYETAQELQDKLNNQGENVLVIQWDKYIIFDLNENKEYRVMSDGNVEYYGQSTMGNILKNTTEANPEQSESRNNGYIGVGTDGNTVNLDLWKYTIDNDVTNQKGYTLNNNIEDMKQTSILDMSGSCGYIAGENEKNIIDGKIKGCVPAYIKSSLSESWVAVTSMFATFYNIKTLTNPPEIPNTVISLRETFLFCDNLISMPEIPSDVTNMGSTFNSCNKLVNVTKIPNKVTNMTCAFMLCSSLENFGSIPDSVTSLQATFYDCKNLKEIENIGKKVENMYMTFTGCTKLETVPEIPSSVTDMRQTFQGCSNLTGLIIINANLSGAIITEGQNDYLNIFFYAATNEDCSIQLTGDCSILSEIVLNANNPNITLLE